MNGERKMNGRNPGDESLSIAVPSKLVEPVTLPTCILEVPGLNIRRDTGYPKYICLFFRLSRLMPRLYGYLKLAHDHFIPNSLRFIIQYSSYTPSTVWTMVRRVSQWRRVLRHYQKVTRSYFQHTSGIRTPVRNSDVIAWDFCSVAYTSYEVPWFVEQMHFHHSTL